jgi:hypothetical protein
VSKALQKGAMCIMLAIAGPMSLPQYWPVYIGTALVGLAYFRLAFYINSRIPTVPPADHELPESN